MRSAWAGELEEWAAARAYHAAAVVLYPWSPVVLNAPAPGRPLLLCAFQVHMGWIEGPAASSLLQSGLIRQPLAAMRFGAASRAATPATPAAPRSDGAARSTRGRSIGARSSAFAPRA
eukprot:10140885-Alexandrium_andersonii.AAC.1